MWRYWFNCSSLMFNTCKSSVCWVHLIKQLRALWQSFVVSTYLLFESQRSSPQGWFFWLVYFWEDRPEMTKHASKKKLFFFISSSESDPGIQNLTTGASSCCSDFTTLWLSWVFGAVFCANIPMMPFCGLVEGLEAALASPFRDFLGSGSSVGARWTSCACCSSREDIGTALVQRMALYL